MKLLRPLLASPLILAALAGCGSGSSSSPTASVGSPTTGAATTNPSAATTATHSAAPRATAASTRCHTSQLAATIDSVQGAAGSSIAAVTLRNASADTCTIQGYVGLAFERGGQQVPTTVNRDTSLAATVVTLAPGATTRFQARANNIPSGTDTSCQPAPDHLLLTPPDETDPLTLTVKATDGSTFAPCTTTVEVRPVGSGAA
ncbi:MAG TPA: DUF4232 domain-containing protein [Frankiaceae bacterium]